MTEIKIETPEEDEENKEPASAPPLTDDDHKDSKTDTGGKDSLDEAVDNIVKNESDEVLDAEDSKAPPTIRDLQSWYKRKKVWIPAAVVLVIVLLLLVPLTRYPILGVVWKQNYKVEVIDSQTSKPVSDVSLTLDGKEATTDNQGYATLRVKVGKGRLVIDKKYYANSTKNVLVPLRIRSTSVFSLKATGRQVPIVLTNKINGQPISDALISAAGTDAKTDANGKVIIVLPADKSSVSAVITDSAYNTLDVTITVTAQTVAANTFQLVPAGSVYFLSNATGTVNVDKANLDGSNQQIAVAGTGDENVNGTYILPSPDWKYVALVSQRSGSNPSLYLINTSNDQLTNIDTAAASYQLYGWTSTDSLIYSLNRLNIAAGQPGAQALKSYNANTGQLIIIDQTNSATTANGQPLTENYDAVTVLANNTINYLKTWQGYTTGSETPLDDTINTSQANGSGKSTLLSLPSDQYESFANSTSAGPNSTYYYLYQSGSNGNTVYYEYTGGKVQLLTDNADVSTATQALDTNTIYYSSPSGDQTLWSTSVNGHTAVVVGDSSAGNQKQIALLDNTYSVYEWYTNNYVLVTNNNNELYIMPVSGVSSTSQLIKISDYL